MVVMKFGGASLRDCESLTHIAEIIREHSFSRRAVVLSAVGGVTDCLLQSIEEALKNEGSIPDSLEKIDSLHRPLVRTCVSDSIIRDRVSKNLQNNMTRLKRLLKGITYTGEATKRTRDHIVSLGERMSVAVMTGCLQDMGVRAEAVETDSIGMVAYGDWGNGTVDLCSSKKALRSHFQALFTRGALPVVTGFFGQTRDGDPITFGRGGTDYSAAVIASALYAERLEIWKDVDGFLSGAPDIVPDGRLLTALSYDEAAELSYFGAKILHPRTVEPLLEKSIPIVIRNTFQPKGVGTWIGPDRHIREDVVKSVTFDRNVAMIRFHGADVGYTVGLLASLVTHLSEVGINIRSVMTAQTCINILLDRGSLMEGFHHLQSIHKNGIDLIEPIKDIGLVAIVGEGLSSAKEPLSRAITALTQNGNHIEMIVSGASKIAAYFIVREEQLEESVQAVHQAFFADSDDTSITDKQENDHGKDV
jgi:aspartokinase/homoserine dehydrogenase 1